jgi:hypothetical protein
VLIYRYKQFITLFASLVILLAQFAVLAHATDHPFHQEDTLCVSMQNAEHDKQIYKNVIYVHLNNVLFGEVAPLFTGIVMPSFNSFYSSRAPPFVIV